MCALEWMSVSEQQHIREDATKRIGNTHGKSSASCSDRCAKVRLQRVRWDWIQL